MKKFGKFLFGTLSLATLAAGAYYVYKNFIKNDTSDDFDEFEDDFDEFDEFDTEDDADEPSEAREYVSIQIDQEDSNVEPESSTTDSADTGEALDDSETEQ